MFDEIETKLDETYDLKSKLYAENANNSILQTSLKYFCDNFTFELLLVSANNHSLLFA